MKPIALFNLWLFLVAGYGLIWAYMALVNRRRGKPIEDPGLYSKSNKWIMFLLWNVPMLGMIASALFIPLRSGILLWVGVSLFLLGIALNISAMHSFSDQPEKVNTRGIYRYSRNPMYVGGFMLLLGLCLMGYTFSLPYALFVLFFILWMLTILYSVKKEEAFLAEKYGEEYRLFKQRIPRYLGLPMTKNQKP
jgi:protein-S-isoprenylcysteine O-methyltransferase Ste14